jgi:lactate dehydrogenase-like 2-hydroxyacid dehydrogenase
MKAAVLAGYDPTGAAAQGFQKSQASMDEFDVLMVSPLSPVEFGDTLGPCRFHKLWQAKDRDGLIAQVRDRVRGIVSGALARAPINAGFMQQFPKLEIIAHMGVGYDLIDAKWAATQNIVVTNTPDVLTEEVADLSIGLLLATVRQIPQADLFLRAGKWRGGIFPLTTSLQGRRLGILGLGRIGKAIGKRAEAFGMSVAYHGRTCQTDVTYEYYPTLVGLAEACDLLMIVAPGGADTRNIVNAEVLDALGPNGILINVARGSVVDEKALIAALRDGKILSAGLDVFADEPRVPQELIDMDHIVLLPHVGSASRETRLAMGQLALDNLLAWASGKPALTPVPETNWPRIV